MLVLSRKAKQVINLRRGDELIRVYVVVREGSVRIGIDADREWNIARDEVDWYADGPIVSGEVGVVTRTLRDPLGVAEVYEDLDLK